MEKIGTPIGSYAPDFELPGTDGLVHHLARYLAQYRAVGVVIMCNHCSYVRLYLDRLKQIQADFQAQGFTLVGINANDDRQFPEDSFEKMKQFAVEQQLNFPYLRDVTQDVAQSLGAERTPEVFLIDQSGVLRYSGAIDNNPDSNLQAPAAAKIEYLRVAIAQLLTSTAVIPSATNTTGSLLKWRS